MNEIASLVSFLPCYFPCLAPGWIIILVFFSDIFLVRSWLLLLFSLLLSCFLASSRHIKWLVSFQLTVSLLLTSAISNPAAISYFIFLDFRFPISSDHISLVSLFVYSFATRFRLYRLGFRHPSILSHLPSPCTFSRGFFLSPQTSQIQWEYQVSAFKLHTL